MSVSLCSEFTLNGPRFDAELPLLMLAGIGSPLGAFLKIAQIDQLQVFDGGPDGLAVTTAGNTLFAVQGIFAP